MITSTGPPRMMDCDAILSLVSKREVSYPNSIPEAYMQEDISQPLTAKSLSQTKSPERPQHRARENSALGNNLDTQSFHLRRRSLPSIIIITLALYSTTFSGVFLLVSLRRQRYPFIRRGGLMSESQAALLTAFLAKTIETFSTTVFITSLGQVISRKAFRRSETHGTFLVDMDLRSLVMQPGRLVTHLGSFRYSIRSILGALTLLAMLSAMLYTTASLPVTATVTSILPIYTDTPCGSQPPGSIYERSDGNQFQLYCNGYDIDFNGQRSYATSSLDFCIELCLESFDGDCAGVSIRGEECYFYDRLSSQPYADSSGGSVAIPFGTLQNDFP